MTSKVRILRWAALENYEIYKEVDGHRDARLPSDLGVVHAIYRVEQLGRHPEFYRGAPLHAECGEPVKARLPVPFDDQDPDACERCAAIATGAAPRIRRGSPPDCYATARADDGRRVTCIHFSRHKGSHRTSAGEVWEDGSEFVSPPPDGYS